VIAIGEDLIAITGAVVDRLAECVAHSAKSGFRCAAKSLQGIEARIADVQ